ncbi:MAG: hypothetical protein COW90_04095 [Nitrospirae bacterium CG22_combo_CG10-13_8_21_14_all_44_11]|nr:MAG: hypothetical protein COW90_04095 [Nitrospirae bacterium CG22_combo_CG10-13_8_21_14_all_44_11]
MGLSEPRQRGKVNSSISMLNQRTIQSIRKYNIIVFLLVIFLFNACAEIEIKTTQPPQSPKVRVYIVAFIERPPKGMMKGSPEGFVKKTYRGTRRFLSDTGIYEIVPQKEVETVLNGKTIPLWHWTKDNYNFTKKIGRALYADFAMMAVRTPKSIYYEFINLETGKVYEARHNALLGMNLGPFEGITMSEELYYQIFSHAKEDLMSIAIRKGKLISQIGTEKKIVSEKAPVASPPVSSPIPLKDSLAESQKFKFELANPLIEKPTEQDKTRIIVYDFNSVNWLTVPALILSEALREELYKLGRFRLVNREDIQRVLSELKLQQSGLVNETQVMQIGQWLAAENAITGKLSPLGNTIVLQTKRINMKTIGSEGHFPYF